MSCTQTIRSISFDRNERFDTGLKFFKISQSRLAFFNNGERKARFNSGEKSAHSSEAFTISVSTGAISSMQSFRTEDGIGSREHDLLGDDLIILLTSSTLTGRNSRNGTPSNTLLKSNGDEVI